MAERPAPELPMPVPVTRHPKMYPPANHPVPNLTKNKELRTKND